MWPVAVICAEHSVCAQDCAGNKVLVRTAADVRDFSQMRNRFMFGAGKQERSHEVASALTSHPRPPTGARFSATLPARKLPPKFILPVVNLFIPAREFWRRRSLSEMNSSESRALGTLNIKRGHSSLYLVIARVKPADGFFALMHRASPSRH